MPNDHHRPVSKAEHRAAYEAHSKAAQSMFKNILALLSEAENTRSAPARIARIGTLKALVGPYHDELAAMSWHYTAAMLAEELGE